MASGGNGGPPNDAAVRLAKRLRDLREREWPDAGLTQAQLADALSEQSRVAPATLSSWENANSSKNAPPSRLSVYARFFASRRSLDNGRKPLPIADLEVDERTRYEQLEAELIGLHAAAERDQPTGEGRRQLLSFDAGPVVLICPEIPEEDRGRLAQEDHANYTRLHRYADADALIEVFGHVRALNPELHVLHRLPADVNQSELQYHLVVLGGIGWNPMVRRIQTALTKTLPIEQFDDPNIETGEVFRVRQDGDRAEQTHYPVTETIDGVDDLVEDVGLIARLPNPFNSSRTLTIYNGIHSKGVVGAVLAVTDETVRPANEKYLAKRFPTDYFAMLVRVPVVSGRVLAPDLQNRETRLFEWSPGTAMVGE